MSQKRHSMVQHRLAGIRFQGGSFITNGTNDPDTADVLGSGFTVTYAAINQLKVTFDGPYRKILSVTATVGNVAACTIATVESLVDGASSPASFNILLWAETAGALANIPPPAAVDECRVHFMVQFLDIGAQ